MASGLPGILSLPASEFRRLWLRFVEDVAATVREALSRTSPELARDVLESGFTSREAPHRLLFLERP
jgi:actin-like ATPase involved in cell morphogenesis